MDANLPGAVVSFLRAHVDHVVKLRFLLAMHSLPGGATVSVMARVLVLPKNQVRDMANELADDGLLLVSRDSLELTLNHEERVTLSELASWHARDCGAVLEVLRAMGRGADG